MTVIRMVTGKHHSQTTCDDQLIDLFVCSLQLMVFLEWPRLSPRDSPIKFPHAPQPFLK